VGAAVAVLISGWASASAQAAEPAPAASAGETVSGTVVRVWAEEEHVLDQSVASGDDQDAGLMTWIDTGDEGMVVEGMDDEGMVQVPTEQLEHVADGSEVRVLLGSDVDASPTGDAGDAGRAVLAAEVLDAPVQAALGEVAPATTVQEKRLAAGSTPHTVSVVMALTPGSTKDAMTLATMKNVVTGPASSFWSDQTGGGASFQVGAASDWTSLSASCSDPFALWKEAAGKVGFTSGPGKHLLVYVTSAGSGCGAGLGTVGSGLTSGGMAIVSGTSGALPSLVSHELGHNMGLGHSDALVCPNGSDGSFSGSWGSGCSELPYRDWFDVMGTSWGPLGSLSTAHADKLGVLGAAVEPATSPKRVTLAAVSGSSGVRGVRVADPDGGLYYVEYRPASGRDSFISSNTRYVEAGVLVRRVNPNGRGGTLLLDGSPTGSNDDRAQALAAGATARTASGRVAITVEEVTGTQATVAVSVDGVSPTASTPQQPVTQEPVTQEPVTQEPVTQEPAPAPGPFGDVFARDYFYEAVNWAVAQQITQGTTSRTFSPRQTVSRGQAVSFLWRSQGKPAGSPSDFDDVPSDAYFSAAAGWASANGVTSGTSSSAFSPYRVLTREQAVTLLWNLAGKPRPTQATTFSDVDPDGYAATAIAWAAGAGVTSGKTATTFGPRGLVTRAEMVTFLHRLEG
jgi:hypothetical protein